MARILITGKNCELSREAFSRAARLASASSLQTGRAAFYSGTTPDSAAGGTRATSSQKDLTHNRVLPLCSPDLEPPQPWLEVLQALREETGLLLILAAIAVATVILALL